MKTKEMPEHLYSDSKMWVMLSIPAVNIPAGIMAGINYLQGKSF